MSSPRTVPFPIQQDNTTAAILLSVMVGSAVWLISYLACWGFVNMSQGGVMKGGVIGALHSVLPFSQGTEIYFDAMRRILCVFHSNLPTHSDANCPLIPM